MKTLLALALILISLNTASAYSVIVGKVMQVIPSEQGLLCAVQLIDDYRGDLTCMKVRAQAREVDPVVILLVGYSGNDVASGDILCVTGSRQGTYNYTTVQGADSTVRRYIFHTKLR